MREVEFNNGFVTALGLFYGHRESFRDERIKKIVKYDMRIYAAADHLFDLTYPKKVNPQLKRKIKRFVKDVFAVRLERPSYEEGTKLFDRCCKLLMEIDQNCFGLNVEVVHP